MVAVMVRQGTGTKTKAPPESTGGAFAEPLGLDLERDKRLELSTYTLARYRSTN
jgi:hypothetical protein